MAKKKNEVALKKNELALKIEKPVERESLGGMSFDGTCDVSFVINLLKKILSICSNHKTDPSYNLALTLTHSIKQFLAMIEMQNSLVDRNPYVMLFCVKCGNAESVFKGDVEKFKNCKKCEPKKAFR